MDEIYTELSLEKMEYKAEGYIPQTIVNYSEFFITHYRADDNGMYASGKDTTQS